MILNAIATNRRVITEKFINKKTKFKKLYILEFEDEDISEKLLISLIKPPRAKVERIIINDSYQNNYRTYWQPIEFNILNNVGENNATYFCRWITDSIHNKKNGSLARNLNLIKLYDDETPTGKIMKITGCLIEDFFLQENPFLRININNCFI